MKLKCLIISSILVSLFCSYSSAIETNLNSFLLISALGNDQLPENNSTKMKSSAKAALFSLAVPGTGQLYSGAKRGYINIVAEVGMFAAYLFIHRNADQLREDCKEQIREYVKFADGKEYFDKWTWEDYEHATMFDNWHNVYTEDTGTPLERVGPFYWEDREAFKDEKRGENADSEYRQEAFDLRMKSNDRFEIARGFLGGIILNHLISAIDARILAKKYNQRVNQELPVTFKVDFSDGFVRGKILYEKFF